MALKGVRVLELPGLAPGPMCGKLLRDFGASVTQINKVGQSHPHDCLRGGKKLVSLDFHKPAGRRVLLRLCRVSDVLIDSYRPGVLEAMSLGPDTISGENPGIVIARLTGFGQTGPLAKVAGHDINYIAHSGVLSALGKYPRPPEPPMNLLADFAGGSLLCAYAILAALLERERTGKGKVLDMSLSEGSAYMASWLFYSKVHSGARDMVWRGKTRGANLLDGGHPLYNVYETSDGGNMALGALEPKFAMEFLKDFGCQHLELDYIFESPAVAQDRIAAHFKTKTRAEWTEIFENTDACCTPVLSMAEAAAHPQSVVRRSFRTFPDSAGPVPYPAPSGIPTEELEPPEPVWDGEDTREVLKTAGYEDAEIDELTDHGIAAESKVRHAKL